MQSHLEDRLETVERAVTDGEADLAAFAEGAATAERVEALEARLDSLEDDVGELDASLQSVRGYVGQLRAVNSEVEETAAAAMAKAERETRDRGESSQVPSDGHRWAPGERESSIAGVSGRSVEEREPGRSGGTGSDRTPERPRAHGPDNDRFQACPSCGRTHHSERQERGGDRWDDTESHDVHGRGSQDRQYGREPGTGYGDEPVASPREPETENAGMLGRVRGLL